MDGWVDGWTAHCEACWWLSPFVPIDSMHECTTPPPGKHKEKTYDPERKLCMLLPAWVSRASAIQRKGKWVMCWRDGGGIGGGGC